MHREHHDVDTCLIFSFLEGSINIIVWPPNSRNTVVIIAEALFEVRSKLAKDNSISGLFVDLGPQSKPGTFA